MGNGLARAIKAKNDAQFRLNSRDHAPSISEGSGGAPVIIDPSDYTVPYTPGKNITFGVAGDQKVINATMNLLEGAGIDISPTNENGGVSIAAVNFIFTQQTASLEWIIDHALNKYPSVSIVDSAGSVVIGDIKYISLSRVVVTFTFEFSGKAYLN